MIRMDAATAARFFRALPHPKSLFAGAHLNCGGDHAGELRTGDLIDALRFECIATRA
jgi:hypothetical protein